MDSLLDSEFSIKLRRNSEVLCPYFGIYDVCDASISSLMPTRKLRKAFCDTENYDNCPIFLSKILRRR